MHPAPSHDHLARAREVFLTELDALQAVCDQLDSNFNRAAELILQTLAARGKLIVAGVGKSGHIGAKIAATLTSTGAPSILLNSVDALHGDLGIISDGDLILLLSYSGETDEILGLIPALKRFDVKIVSFTGNPHSSLAQCSDAILNVRVPREACPFNLAPTSSSTAMLVMGDALAITLLEARGFRPRDFAKHHPSGAIGRALLIRVREIMRTGKRNPVIEQSRSVKEALLVMTRAKSGSVSVIDPDGKLAGIFTDGDLRRHMAFDDQVLEQPISKFMTRGPVVIQEDALAVEALKIFQQRQIDDLVVVNAESQPVGLVDSQDLPKLKLM